MSLQQITLNLVRHKNFLQIYKTKIDSSEWAHPAWKFCKLSRHYLKLVWRCLIRPVRVAFPRISDGQTGLNTSKLYLRNSCFARKTREKSRVSKFDTCFFAEYWKKVNRRFWISKEMTFFRLFNCGRRRWGADDFAWAALVDCITWTCAHLLLL